MSNSDIQCVIEKAAREAAIQAVNDLDLPGGQLLVSGMSGVARILDMSRTKVHRLRRAAAASGIQFPEPALDAGVGGTKSYWRSDIRKWVRTVREARIGW